MVFYGGTVPYAILEKEPDGHVRNQYFDQNDGEWETSYDRREFGDIDIYAPIKLMKEIRKAIMNMKGFSMGRDSANLQRVHRKKSIEEINPIHREVYNKLIHKDFGFFGDIKKGEEWWSDKVGVSVYPLFEQNNSIKTRGFRESNGYRDGEFLIDAGIVNNMGMAEFVTPAKILGKNVRVAPMEYTVASKKRAIEKDWKKRIGKDEFDINFIMQHASELGINPELIKRFDSSVPRYSLEKAYEMEDGEAIAELDGEQFQERVFSKMKEKDAYEYW